MKKNISRKKTFIFDIDGVLSNPSQRIDNYQKIFDASDDIEKSAAIDEFVSQSIYDSAFEDVCKLCFELSNNNHIIFLTGRAEKFRHITEQWIQDNIHWTIFKDENSPNGHRTFDLFMKPNGDLRNSKIFKEEVYIKAIKFAYDVVGVFEDREDIVEMWRNLGLTVYALPSIFNKS